jgi:hypothetical protein
VAVQDQRQWQQHPDPGHAGVSNQTERLRWLQHQLDTTRALMRMEQMDPSEDGGRLLALLDQTEAMLKDAIATLLSSN